MLELAKSEDAFDFLPATPHSAKIQSLYRTYGGGNSYGAPQQQYHPASHHR